MPILPDDVTEAFEKVKDLPMVYGPSIDLGTIDMSQYAAEKLEMEASLRRYRARLDRKRARIARLES